MVLRLSPFKRVQQPQRYGEPSHFINPTTLAGSSTILSTYCIWMWIPETQLQHSSLEVDQSLCGETYQWGLPISQNVKRQPSADIVRKYIELPYIILIWLSDLVHHPHVPLLHPTGLLPTCHLQGHCL